MFRRSQEPAAETKKTSGDVNGEDISEPAPAPDAPLNSAQKLAASSESPDPFAREAKHFTEIRVLHREGLAKYMGWSASMLEADAKLRLMSADIQSKKTRLGMFTNYVPPKLDSKAKFKTRISQGKLVVEVVSAYCVVVADDSIPFGSPLAERRVNLSSITSYKIGDERREDGKPDPWAREAKEFLLGRLIGRQVNVSLEYSRRFNPAVVGSTGPGEARVMDFGSVFIASPPVKEGGEASSPAAGIQAGVNVAELMVTRGYAVVVRHKDFEARSNFYDALVAAEYRAIAGKKAKHSKKEPLAMHIADLMTVGGLKMVTVLSTDSPAVELATGTLTAYAASLNGEKVAGNCTVVRIDSAVLPLYKLDIESYSNINTIGDAIGKQVVWPLNKLKPKSPLTVKQEKLNSK